MAEGLKRRLIAGTIHWYKAEDGWVNVHMDKSPRQLVDPDPGGVSHPPDVVWDITDLNDSPENDYDEVKCWQTLEHVEAEKAQQTLTGFFRILKPGGVLDIEVPNMDAITKEWNKKEPLCSKEDLLNGIFGDPKADMFPDPGYMEHRTVYWPSKLRAMLKEAGFTNVRKADAGSLQLRLRAVKPE